MSTPSAETPWASPAADVLTRAESSASGLSAAEAEARLARRPPEAGAHRAGWVLTLVKQFTSPIVLILLAATVLSMALGDVTDGFIIIGIIAASGLLGFLQDHRAGRDVAALMARVQVLAEVLRDGEPAQVPVARVVAGDVVVLKAGSVIPCDCRLLTSTDLLVDESSLTGESFPVEKDAAATVPADAALAKRPTTAFFGTHVVSGSATAVAWAVGRDTQLGQVTHELRESRRATSYERGISRFGSLLVVVMVVLTVAIFAVNTAFGRPFIDSLLFSLALAVGLTPQMLPAIVTISLSTGARLLAQRKAIVKRLEAIEDLGSMSVLCTDKTGTLTAGAPALDLALGADGRESERVLRLAALNAGLQSTFVNPIDAAILARAQPPADARRLGEIPYDFSRKRLSVLTTVDGAPTLIVKGAYDLVTGLCAGEDAQALDARYRELSAQGYRVLAVATRAFPGDPGSLGVADETGLTLAGLVAFHDPVKPSVPQAVAELRDLGVSLRLITGDNALAAKATAAQIGLDAEHVLTGPEIERLHRFGGNSPALADAIRTVAVFAEVEPHHKQLIVASLRASGVTTGFMGDGINDAPALHAADVGLSVDTAVDVAREAAAVVLLDQSLEVVIDAVRTGRQTFANTLKYARLTTSANFGNMLSMAAASLFLPFLPLLPRQILLLNFLTDIPSTGVSTDRVDPEQTARPAAWRIASLGRFMVVFGALSTVFDLLTFVVLVQGFDVSTTEFRSAWFIESSVSELAVLFSLRTVRPLWRSAPARLLTGLSALAALVIVAIPHIGPVADAMGLDALPGRLWLAVAGLVVVYVAANEVAKRLYARRGF